MNLVYQSLTLRGPTNGPSSGFRPKLPGHLAIYDTIVIRPWPVAATYPQNMFRSKAIQRGWQYMPIILTYLQTNFLLIYHNLQISTAGLAPLVFHLGIFGPQKLDKTKHAYIVLSISSWVHFKTSICRKSFKSNELVSDRIFEKDTMAKSGSHYST